MAAPQAVPCRGRPARLRPRTPRQPRCPSGGTLSVNICTGALWRTRYEPYGNIAAGVVPTDLGFTGHVNDAVSGLVYMQQRYYDPIAGRFLSTDPVTTDADTGRSFGRYHYAENNPYAYVDPTGMNSECSDACMKMRATSDAHSLGQSTTAAGSASVAASSLARAQSADSSVSSPAAAANAPTTGGSTATLDMVAAGFDKLMNGECGKTVICGTVPIGGLGKSAPQLLKQVAKIERQLAQHGAGSVKTSLQSLERRLGEHQRALEQYRAAGGFTSSVEREIRAFEREIEAIHIVLGKAK